MKRKIFAALLAVMMVVSMLPLSVLAADNCEHDYKVVPTTFGMHQFECQKCGDAYGAGQCKGADTDYDGTCNMCNTQYKHVCDMDGLRYKDARSHNITCSRCGRIGGNAGHSYDETKSVSEMGHVLACACGAEKKNALVMGHYDADGDGKCDSCGYQKYDAPDKEHEHNYVAHSNNDGTHTLSCTCGGEVKDITCNDGNGDGKCDSCGYEKYVAPEEEHEHNYVAHSNNDGTHTSSCNCGLSVTINCLDNNGDGKCDSCGYQKYDAPEGEHEHNYVAHSNNDGTHTLSCTCGGEVKDITCNDNDGDGKCDSCGYQKYVAPEEEHEHNYVAHSNNDGTHTSSCNCGLSITINCLDNDGDGKCDSCGYQKYDAPEGEHEHNYVAHSNNDGTHTSSCNCGLSVTINCLDNDGDGKCDSCGYQKYVAPEEEHEHNYVAHSNNNGTHTLSCTCGLAVTITCLDSDGDGKCDSCGYQKYDAPEGEHEHNYVAHSNNDGTHTLSCNCGLAVKFTCLDNNGDGKCDSCGYQKYVAPEEEPKPEKPEPKFDTPIFPNLRNIVIDTTEGGKTSVASDRAFAALGSTYHLTLTPEEGYEIGEVLVNGKAIEANKNNKISFVVKANTYVEVEFVEIED